MALHRRLISEEVVRADGDLELVVLGQGKDPERGAGWRQGRGTEGEPLGDAGLRTLNRPPPVVVGAYPKAKANLSLRALSNLDSHCLSCPLPVVAR